MDYAVGLGTTVAATMSSAGVQRKVKVLFVAHNTPSSVRLAVTARLWRELSQVLPGFDVSVALSEGPFEDDTGDAHAHFDVVSQHKPPATRVLETMKDLFA